MVAPRTPYFDILWSKPSNSQKKCHRKVGKKFGLLGTPADWVLLKVYSNTYLKVILDLVSSEKSVAETQMRAVMMRGP